MALAKSKACIGMHLSANNLDYYERIFVRSLMNAKVQNHFRNMAEKDGSIKSQKERNLVQNLKFHDYDSQPMQDFVK